MTKLISETVGGLYNGVSQQAELLRYPNQVAEQLNFESRVDKGLEKRHSTYKEFVTETGEDIVDTKSYDFEDSEGNKYFVSFNKLTSDEKVLTIFNKDTKQVCEVTYEGDALAYLQSADDVFEDLRMAVVADYMFVSNNKVTVAMLADTHEYDTTGESKRSALVWIKKAVSSTTYTVNGTQNSDDFTTTATAFKSNLTADALQTLTGYKSSTIGSVCVYEGDEDHVTGMTVSDSFGDSAMVLIKGVAGKISDLPPNAPDNYVAKITGDSDSDNEYYMRYNLSEDTWKESVAMETPYKLDPSTMPS